MGGPARDLRTAKIGHTNARSHRRRLPRSKCEFWIDGPAANPLPESGRGLSPLRDRCQGAWANFAVAFAGNFHTQRGLSVALRPPTTPPRCEWRPPDGSAGIRLGGRPCCADPRSRLPSGHYAAARAANEEARAHVLPPRFDRRTRVAASAGRRLGRCWLAQPAMTSRMRNRSGRLVMGSGVKEAPCPSPFPVVL